MNRKLKFGVIINSDKLSTWKVNCLEELLNQKDVELDLVVQVPNRTNKLELNFKYFFWYIYNYFFIKRSKSSHLIDTKKIFEGKKRIFCSPIKFGKYSIKFSNNDIQKIKSYELDFILRFSIGEIIKGDILTSSKYGIWSFHMGDDQEYRGKAPGFWEIYNYERKTGAILQKLTEKLDGGVILKKGYIDTINTSYIKNRDKIHFSVKKWLNIIIENIRPIVF